MKKINSVLHQIIQSIKKSSLRKKVIIVILLTLLGWFIGSRVLEQSSKKPQYVTATVQKGSIISTLSGSGSVTSETQVNVTSPTNGIISEVYVKNGEEVTAGTSLFAVTSTASPQEKATAYASYLSAQNAVNAATAKMNSLQATLFKANQDFVNGKGTANPDTNDPIYIQERAMWLQSEADYNNQAGVISQSQAAYSAASLAYQATQNSVVVAPTSGSVANLSAQPGTVVTASSNSGSSGSSTDGTDSSSGTAVLILGNFSDLVITMQVSEVDITKIKAGLKATVTIDALPDQTFVGNVTSVDSVGTSSSGVVTYNAYVRLVSPPETIKAGMTTSVVVQLQRKDSVLTVPSTAVQTSDGESTVRVLKNNTVTAVPVEVGISSDSDTEIVSGLSEGDTVITSIVTQTTTGASGQTASPFGGSNRMFGGSTGAGTVIRANSATRRN